MLDFSVLNYQMKEELGESGFEAFVCAVQSYLMYEPEQHFACEEDKLILLMWLYSVMDLTIKDEFNPLLHFKISFDRSSDCSSNS